MAASKAAQPIGARKLNREIRYKIALLAAERFRSPALREIEAKALQNVTDVFMRDVTAIPAKEIKVLEKYRYACPLDVLRLPYSVNAPVEGERTFTRPDGVEVTRKGAEKPKTIACPGDDDRELPSFHSWNGALQINPGRDAYSRTRYIELPKRVMVPGTLGTASEYHDKHAGKYLSYFDFQRDETESGFYIHSVRSAFLTPDVLTAIRAYYAAGDQRINEERRLICAAIKVVASCDVYGQVIDFWPEVAEIEESLFDKIVPNAFALVALSDDDKAALCANMASRGVQGGLCSRQAA